MAEVARRVDRAFLEAGLSPPSAKTRAEAEAFVRYGRLAIARALFNANSRAPAMEALPFLPQRINFCHEYFTLLNL
jgi:hypothetical protein